MKENNNEKMDFLFRITLMRKDTFSYIDVDINGNGVDFVYFKGHYSEESFMYLRIRSSQCIKTDLF